MEHVVLGQNLLVKQKEALKMTEGGIVVPDGSRAKPLQGTVIKWGVGGDGRSGTHFLHISEGDEVLFDRFAGTPVELDGEEYLVMNQDDILIILKGVK